MALVSGTLFFLFFILQLLFQAQVINYVEEGVFSIKYENDKADEFYELHVGEDTWRPHFAFYDEGVQRKSRLRKKGGRGRGGRQRRSRCGVCKGCVRSDCGVRIFSLLWTILFLVLTFDTYYCFQYLLLYVKNISEMQCMFRSSKVWWSRTFEASV